MVELSGNTYPHRTTLRAAGARWDADRKVWTCETDRKGRCPSELVRLSGVDWRIVAGA